MTGQTSWGEKRKTSWGIRGPSGDATLQVLRVLIIEISKTAVYSNGGLEES